MIGWFLVLAGPAVAGELAAEIAADTLTATTVAEPPGVGEPERLGHTELGLRLRGDLWQERFHAAVDYRAREPMTGPLRDQTHRLLYVGTVGYEAVEGTLTLDLGRFPAPAAILLPVDGLRATWTPTVSDRLTVFGGRRGISTSRRNLPFTQWLPAFGAAYDRVSERLQASAVATYSADEVVFASGGGVDEHTEVVAGVSGLGRVVLKPADPLWVGAQASFIPQATYLLGPTWADATVEVQAVDLFTALLWTYLTPSDHTRVDMDLHHQGVQLFQSELVGERGVDVQEPRHTDVRVRGGVSPAGHGWIRPEVRYRMRPDRTELRYGGLAELYTPALPGPVIDLRAFVDDIGGTDQPDDRTSVDRLQWSAGAGYDRGPVDVSVGASFIERSAAPVSGRTATLTNPSAPTTSTDLAPFVLEAQDVLFARGFLSLDQWFAGMDVEKGLADAEWRAMVQVGWIGGAAW